MNSFVVTINDLKSVFVLYVIDTVVVIILVDPDAIIRQTQYNILYVHGL